MKEGIDRLAKYYDGGKITVFAEPGRYLAEDSMDFYAKVDEVLDNKILLSASALQWFLRNKIYH